MLEQELNCLEKYKKYQENQKRRNAIGKIKPQIQVVKNPKQAKKLEIASPSTKIKENIVVKNKQGVQNFIKSWQMKILNKSTEPLHRKGWEDSNLQISSGSGTSSNQGRPAIPNFGTAADLNFRQEYN